jgi:CHAT domain-containing protein
MQLDEKLQYDLRHGDQSWSYLPATHIEVSNIYDLANNHDINANLYTGTEATESTFKKLSGNSNGIIHVATHGFYIKPMSDREVDDDNLKRSGLAFAGANNIQKGITIPKGIDDGILTASEISNLKFNELDLIVLSACETGLGDINAEGVYGLQRAFKKAGANSLIISLWKVADSPTQILMSNFYNNLFSGKSKYESLEAAKKHVRTINNGQFADPKFWAGFILLDGIDYEPHSSEVKDTRSWDLIQFWLQYRWYLMITILLSIICIWLVKRKIVEAKLNDVN